MVIANVMDINFAEHHQNGTKISTLKFRKKAYFINIPQGIESKWYLSTQNCIYQGFHTKHSPLTIFRIAN